MKIDPVSKTCDDFWECNCDEYFVHRKIDKHCNKCNHNCHESADATITDIYNQRDNLNLTFGEMEDLMSSIIKYWNINL